MRKSFWNPFAFFFDLARAFFCFFWQKTSKWQIPLKIPLPFFSIWHALFFENRRVGHSYCNKKTRKARAKLQKKVKGFSKDFPICWAFAKKQKKARAKSKKKAKEFPKEFATCWAKIKKSACQITKKGKGFSKEFSICWTSLPEPFTWNVLQGWQ